MFAIIWVQLKVKKEALSQKAAASFPKTVERLS
jgi:hypothetical protein